MRRISHTFTHFSKEEFVKHFVGLYAAMAVDDELQLTHRETEFFVQCVIMYNEGESLDDSNVVSEIAEKLNINENHVYKLRSVAKKKLWIEQTTEGYKIPDVFIFKKGLTDVRFDIGLELAEDETRAEDFTGGSAVLAGEYRSPEPDSDETGDQESVTDRAWSQ